MLEILFDLFLVVICIAVLWYFGYFYICSRRKDPVEEGKTALFLEQCRGRFNGFNIVIPSVRHAIYDDFIRIAYGRKKIVLKNEDVNSVWQIRHFISRRKGIRYNHSRSDIPRWVILWSKRPAEVIRLVNEKGIPVESRME
jgi:hypothetical protein